MMPQKQKTIIAVGFVAMVFVILLAYSYIKQENKKTFLKITSEPSRIEIYIGNKREKYQTPVTIPMAPGKYTIWGAKTGYETAQQQVAVKRGQTNNLHIQLKKAIEPPEGAPLNPPTQPKIKNLPFETDHFRVDWDENNQKYLLVPNIPFTAFEAPQVQIKNNWNLYEKYAKEALEWLKKQGVTPTKNNIEWWAEEWWPEGKTISF
jgi:hypothetical protein